VGKITEPGGHVDTVSDVVVTLHQNDVAGRHSGTNRDGLSRARYGADDVVQLENGGQQGWGFDAHQHHPVTEPFGDAHTSSGTDLTQQRPERCEHFDRIVVTLTFGQGREV
jgi:hypothetical protein